MSSDASAATDLSHTAAPPSRIAPWALVALAYVAAVALGVAYAAWLQYVGNWNAGLPWEREAMHRVHELQVPWLLDRYLLAVPWAGTNLTLFPAALLASVWLVVRRRRWDLAIWLMTVELGCLSMNWLIKHLTGRARPDLWERVGWFGWGSYPSGHAMVSIAVLGTVAVMLHRERGWRWPFAVVAVLVLSIVYSRMYHGVHWPTDMIGGAIVGVLWLLVTAWVFGRPHPGLRMRATRRRRAG